MIFSGSLPRLKGKASSKTPVRPKAGRRAGLRIFGRELNLEKLLQREAIEFDLLSQLTHMAAVSTAGMNRAQLFEGTAGLSYSTSKYFRQVHLVAQRLNYDYSRACELVADTVKVESVRNLLLHFATSLSSGELEEVFLTREATLQLQTYAKEYEQKVQSLQKWSDAYVAIMVSATLVVVISLVSMMIYPFSPMAIVALALLMVCVTFVGGWLIFTIAPIEVKTHTLRYRSPEQERAGQLAKALLPLAAITGLGVGWWFGLPFALIVSGIAIAPIGIIALIDDWKIDARDRDIATFIRGLGSVMGSASIGVTEGLGRLNRRSLGSVEPLVRRLYIRIKNAISPDLSWLRMAAESGSELVTRAVRIFWDGVRMGGEVEKVAGLASDLSLKIALLRADRKLASMTFTWVVVPLHAVLIAILLFVTEVVQVFGKQLADVQAQSLQGGVAAEAGVSDVLLFQFPALDFVPVFIGTVALLLTAANAFAPYAATGGHRLKLCLFAAIMMLLSGITLLVVPSVVHAIFQSVAEDPSGAATNFSGTSISATPTPFP